MAKKKQDIDVLLEASVEELNKRVECSLDKIKIGDTVFISNDDKVSYTVLDIGNPFVLILNDITNFAQLYKTTKLYKHK